MSNIGYKIVLALTLTILVINSFAVCFVSPIKFKGTEKEKNEVIKFIEINVKHAYASIGMKEPIIIKAAEKEELKAFKKLTKVNDKELLDKIIKQSKAKGIEDYLAIWELYQEQENNSIHDLEWQA